MMRARSGIDKTKAWADSAEEEEEADAMILTLEAATKADVKPKCDVETAREAALLPSSLPPASPPRRLQLCVRLRGGRE